MTTSDRTLRVGITGTIGTGKSEVCRYLARKGYPVVDADRVARTLTETSVEIQQRLRDRFGPDVFDETGRLKRRELARIVFRDAGALRALNAIVHPPMIAAIREEIERFCRGDPAYVFVEAAVIYEAGMEGLFDVVAVVAADVTTSVKRVAKRDELAEEEVWDRYRAQIPLEDKIKRADYVIWNDGSLTELQRRAEEFLQWLESRRAEAGAGLRSENVRSRRTGGTG